MIKILKNASKYIRNTLEEITFSTPQNISCFYSKTLFLISELFCLSD
ncbi:MAG: hypothetical protein Q8830_03550 [Candidatus Phytoplasma australasiaticum]|nr:hypothetical protein [Candidatus Phytoplasma australasiaticum]